MKAREVSTGGDGGGRRVDVGGGAVHGYGRERVFPPLVVFGTSHHPAICGPVCAGCGQVPWNFRRFDAATMVRFIGRRCEELLGQPDVALDYHAPSGAWQTALELIAGAIGVLAEAKNALAPGLVSASPVPAVTPLPWRAVVVADLRDNIAGLVAAIEAVPVADWDPVPVGLGEEAPAGMAWLALHDANHRLEDAELTVRAALAGRPSLPADAGDPRYPDRSSSHPATFGQMAVHGSKGEREHR